MPRRRNLWTRALQVCSFVGVVGVSLPLAPAAAQAVDVQDRAALSPTDAHDEAKRDAPSAQRGKKDTHKARGARAARARARAERPRRKKSTYEIMRDSWHEPAPEELCAEARTAAIRDLVFKVQGTNETYVLHPESALGGFDEAQLEVARQAFGAWEGGPTPHRRVLDLIYAATLHFDVPYVHLISGVRKDRGGSRHSHGLAADVVLPGVEDEELAAFFRAQGFVGVGTYPRSGFVHVDTRDQSFFWVDRSSPGRRSRVVQVRALEARTVDEAALVRGNTTFVNPPRLQRALNARASRRRRAREAREQRAARRQQIASGESSTTEMNAH